MVLIANSSQVCGAEDNLRINMGFAKNSIQGQFQIKVVGLALDNAKIQHNFIRRPAARALYNVEHGIDDGNILRIKGLEKQFPNLIMVPTSVVDYEFVAFTRPDFATPIETWSGLNDLNVGIVIGWKIVEENTQHVKTLTKVENGERLFQLLNRGRFDVVVYEYWQGLEIARSLGIKNIKLRTRPLAIKAMHIYLNKRHSGLVPAIDAAILKLRTGDTYANLYNQAFTPLSDWAQSHDIPSALHD